MKIAVQTRAILCMLAAFFLANCQAEKEKDFFGIGEEETSLLFTGLVLNQGFRDTKDGNIVDRVNGVIYKKCVSGQVYRPNENDCRGIQRGSLYTPNDVVLFGAVKLGYCDINSWNCNSKAFPFPLIGTTVVQIAGVAVVSDSEAFNYCNSFNTATDSGWRVATPIELRRLTFGGRNAMLQFFPDTPEDWFWSNWARPDDEEGITALAVSFERSNFGEEKAFEKRGRKYVRCARSTPLPNP